MHIPAARWGWRVADGLYVLYSTVSLATYLRRPTSRCTPSAAVLLSSLIVVFGACTVKRSTSPARSVTPASRPLPSQIKVEGAKLHVRPELPRALAVGRREILRVEVTANSPWHISPDYPLVVDIAVLSDAIHVSEPRVTRIRSGTSQTVEAEVTGVHLGSATILGRIRGGLCHETACHPVHEDFIVEVAVKAI